MGPRDGRDSVAPPASVWSALVSFPSGRKALAREAAVAWGIGDLRIGWSDSGSDAEWFRQRTRAELTGIGCVAEAAGAMALHDYLELLPSAM